MDKQKVLKKLKGSNGAMSDELFNFIRSILPDGSTILELGSGAGTRRLVKHYTVYSIEHDKNWIGVADSNYIYAPLKNGWYSIDPELLPKDYDLIFIDGPPAHSKKIGRRRLGFYDNIALFNTNKTMVFDDVNRPGEMELLEAVSKKVGRRFEVRPSKTIKYKEFGIIYGADE